MCISLRITWGRYDAPVHQGTNAPGYPLQGAKGWEFAVVFHQHFRCGVDKICWGFHYLSSFVHRLRCNMPNVLALTLDLQMRSDRRVIAVERVVGGNIRDEKASNFMAARI
jgi:hypothetical protein